MFKFLLFKLGQLIVNILPPHAAYRFAFFFADLQYHSSAEDRRYVTDNLRDLSIDQKKLKVTTREVFRSFARYLVEFFRMKKDINQEYLKDHVKLQNIERVDQVLKQGRGCLIVSSHIGNWELGAAILSLLGYPTSIIALPHKQGLVNKLFNDQREAKGIEVIPTSQAIKRGLNCLRENRILALNGDRTFGARGEMLPFLGKVAPIPRGAAMFALKSGAPIVPTFLIRTRDYQYTFIFENPIYPPQDKNNDKQAQVLSIMKAYVAVMEKYIRQYPTQWLMFKRIGEP